jgi:hypothetical protein
LATLAATACNSPAPTDQSDNTTVNAAEAAAREMHNQMSANEMAHDQHSGMQGMNGMGMGNMPADSMGNMQGNSMNSTMPMEDDSGHM